MYDPGTLYLDPILTNFSVGFDDQTLYGRSIFPETPVRTQSGKYNVFDRSNWVVHESRREPGAVANEIVGAKWSTDVFSTQEHSLQSPILDEERQQLTSLGGLANPGFGGNLGIDPEVDATELVTRSILLAHEKKVADTVRNAANYGASNKVTLAGSQQWDDYTFVTAGQPYSIVSNPVGAIQAGIRAIWTATRRRPNTLVIPTMGIPYIENHPRIVDRFKTFSLLQPDAFKLLTGFDGRIITVDSMYNSANNIDATAVMTDFWGKDVWLGIVDPTPGQRTKTFGKTFAQIYPDGSVRPTDRWREEPRKADIVRVSMKYDLKITSAEAGYLITSAFSSGAWS
jgi:hypothetical protein